MASTTRPAVGHSIVRLVLGVALGAGVACEATDNGGSTTDGGTGSTGSASTSSTSGGTADTASSTGGGGSGATGSTTAGGCPVGACCDTIPEAKAICAAATTQADCETAQVDPGFGACVWETWVPVTLEGETCTFGRPTQRCALEGCYSEGCNPRPLCGDMLGSAGALIEEPDGEFQVGYADWCYAPEDGSWVCSWDQATGDLFEGPPVCDCLCDPAFPG